MSLEPRLVLLVKTPALVLEGLGGEELLICALLVIKQVEQRIGIDAPGLVQPWVVEDPEGFLRIVQRGVVRVLGLVMTRLFGICRFGTGRERCCQEALRGRGWVG